MIQLLQATNYSSILTVATWMAILQRDHRDETFKRLTQYGESTWLLDERSPSLLVDTESSSWFSLPAGASFALDSASQPSGSSFAKERCIGQHLVYQLMECHTKHLHSSLLSVNQTKLTASTLRLLTAMLMQGLYCQRDSVHGIQPDELIDAKTKLAPVIMVFRERESCFTFRRRR